MDYTSTILIVDDELGGRKTLEALLKAEGFNLIFAASGAEALDKAAEFAPDLVLLDVMMPGMDGFEVCRRLRADPFLAEVPVIMVTALDDRDSRLLGIEAGADDFVSKPLDRNELRARVRTTTRLNRYRRLLLERTKFEWVVEQAEEGYVMLSEDGQMPYANPRARLYLGLPSDAREPISETFLELASQLYRCEPEEAWRTWTERRPGDPCPPGIALYLVRPESPAAHAVWLHVESLDLTLPAKSGRDASRLIRLRDVTAQMAMQRDSWSFQVMVGHKLRTPLTNMIGSLELMAHHAARLSHDEVAEFSAITLRNVKRLYGDIEDVLQYLDVSGGLASDGECSLSELQSLVTQVGVELGLERITVTHEAELDQGWVLLSPPTIEMVLWEVLENARKFHPQRSPTVDVRISRKRDPSGLPGREISLQIRDDGVTLSPALLARVWAPYYQGEKWFTGEVVGMGLGLPLVATIVWGAGGACRIQNRADGPGVVVTLDLPCANDHQPV